MARVSICEMRQTAEMKSSDAPGCIIRGAGVSSLYHSSLRFFERMWRIENILMATRIAEEKY
jgi:hypothetical protein